MISSGYGLRRWACHTFEALSLGVEMPISSDLGDRLGEGLWVESERFEGVSDSAYDDEHVCRFAWTNQLTQFWKLSGAWMTETASSLAVCRNWSERLVRSFRSFRCIY